MCLIFASFVSLRFALEKITAETRRSQSKEIQLIINNELDYIWERYMGLGCAVAPFTHLPIYFFTLRALLSVHAAPLIFHFLHTPRGNHE
jgi:hypothetical protein